MCIGCGISLIVLKIQESPHIEKIFWLETIPIVSVIFTWGHIWLAVQMMFYPIRFCGIWNYRNSGYGLGWQGVVPRKAAFMAETTCTLMLGRVISMEEVVDRVELDEFFETLGDVLLDCQKNVNETLGPKHFPKYWAQIPSVAKDEILEKVMETQRDSFHPIMKEIRCNIVNIIDFKEMCVRRYTEEPTLLITLFQQVGRKEFQFIQRCGAQMGLVLGLGQMGLYFLTSHIEWMPWVLLPVSGLIIGNFTNWLAIKMIFNPTYPHYYCNGRFNFQGLFLKRQKQVATELAKMVTDTVVNGEQMIKYLVDSPGYNTALDIFNRHTARACDEVLGYAKSVVPRSLGADRWELVKEDIVTSMLDELPKKESHFIKYFDQALKIESTIAERLSALPPNEFEGMLHPAFQEDEWMLITLGGVLGVVVGLVQAAVLRQ